MRIDQLKPSVIVRGPIFPEPVQVIVSIPMGQSVKLVGKGLTTGQVHEPILNAEQVATLEATPEKAPFDGDPQRFRLGIEARRLGLAYEYDPYFATGRVEWKASGGTIDKDGVFAAGQDEGSFVVTAISGPIGGSATLIVARAGTLPPPAPRPPAAPGVLRWTGEIPPQKWMNFYTKVLSKFVSGQGLRLTLSIEVSPEGGISSQKIEETKVALQELGLNSDLEMR